MRQSPQSRRGKTAGKALYDGIALIGDPIHQYISFTVPYGGRAREATEKDLIDSSWMQRLRYIYQLQSARWVFPSAEHSRFVHSLGAMHVAGRFARHLYPSLQEVVPDCPSECFIEELLRVATLLHDSGHGPFGHFFDDNVLDVHGLTHEVVGQHIIRGPLAPLIRRIRRSPHGDFARGEQLKPAHVAFLIRKDAAPSDTRLPRWLTLLQPLLSGVYTVDNLDYVLRDAYMCGISTGPVDLSRLIHYSFFTEHGLTLHRVGGAALAMFLNTRLYLYSNVYYHRTTRAIDLHLREIFRDTVDLLFPRNPLECLDAYLDLTDWALLQEVRTWAHARDRKRRALGREWARLLSRDVKWKMAYDTTLSMREVEKGQTLVTAEDLETRIRKRLPKSLKDLAFRVDMASQDPRPLNPLMMGERQIYVYNPSTRRVSTEPLQEYFDTIPAKVVHCRIFSTSHQHDAVLSGIAETVLHSAEPSIKTNV